MVFNVLTTFSRSFTNLANAVQLNNTRIKKPGFINLGFLSLALVKTQALLAMLETAAYTSFLEIASG